VKQKGPTRPLHTLNFYQMQLMFLGFIFCFLLYVGKRFDFGSFVWIWFLIYPFKMSCALRKGEYITPLLSSYSGARKEVEYRHIVKTLTGFMVATVIAVMVFAAQVRWDAFPRLSLITAVIMFNLYGWFAYNWWREVFVMIVEHREQRQNNGLDSLLPSSSMNTGPFVESPVGMVVTPPRDSSLSSMRVGVGKS